MVTTGPPFSARYRITDPAKSLPIIPFERLKDRISDFLPALTPCSLAREDLHVVSGRVCCVHGGSTLATRPQLTSQRLLGAKQVQRRILPRQNALAEWTVCKIVTNTSRYPKETCDDR